MRHDLHDGIVDLDRHLERLARSAAALGFHFDRHQARNELQAASFGAGRRQGAAAAGSRRRDRRGGAPASSRSRRSP
jgi:branched-subunit amino acid aminotransferase/4-amino-4-deoxychorismate lyase